MKELELKSTRDSLNFWNFSVLVIVAALLISFVPCTPDQILNALGRMTPFHFIVLGLATFRMTRLFVADFIMGWLRDMFLRRVIVRDDVGNIEYVRYEKYEQGFRRLVSDLLGCPWCVGVWMAFVALVLYALAISGAPIAWVIIYIFALAGAGEFAYALIGALLTPHASSTLLVDAHGVNILSGQKHHSSENICTECGK